ncbi:MAG: hypothetical protein AAGB24_10230 [Bacteroidota bacterium]
MKNLVLACLLCAIATNVKGQKTIEKNIDHNNQYIEVDVKFASTIEVKTWDKSNIYVKADIWTKDEKYQDLYQLNVIQNSSHITIVSDTEAIFNAFHDAWKRDGPNQKGYGYTTKRYEFDYVVYVPKNARFKVSSINGSLQSELIEGEFEAALVNGNIDIKNYLGNLDLNTINGEIDLKVGNANFMAETINGDIYADKQLQVKSYDRHVGQKIEHRINGSSSKLSLNTVNGNMYLRL